MQLCLLPKSLVLPLRQTQANHHWFRFGQSSGLLPVLVLALVLVLVLALVGGLVKVLVKVSVVLALLWS
jgi:hypothetical protein